MNRHILRGVLCVILGNSINTKDVTILWYQQPAENWVEALPLDNGRLGAMMFGSAPKEWIQLNEESLWAGESFNVYLENFANNLKKVQNLAWTIYQQISVLSCKEWARRPGVSRTLFSNWTLFVDEQFTLPWLDAFVPAGYME